MKELVPYGDAGGTDIGDLTLETDADVVSIYGSLSIHKDEQGLRDVRRMIRILQAAERTIEDAIRDGVVSEAQEAAPRRGPNPFG